MKILFVSFDNFPHVGGKSTHIKFLMNGLRRIGCTADIVSPADANKLLLLIVLKLPCYILGNCGKKGQALSFWWREFFQGRILRNLCKKIIINGEFDVVLSQDVVSCNIVKEIRYESQKKFKLKLTVHGDKLNEILSTKVINRSSWFARKIEANEINGYRNADEIICVDTRLKHHVCALLADFNPQKPVTVVYNFIDYDEFSYSYNVCKNELPIILCPRRLTTKNGVKYAVQAVAWEKLRSGSVPYVLYLAGDGPVGAELRKYVEENALSEHVVFLGDVNHENMMDLYRDSTIVLIPSVPSEGVIEATSISALEGMALGVPVIASNIGGLSELIDNQSGVLLAPGNPEVIAEAIYALINDPDRMKMFSENARNKIINSHSHIEAALIYSKV